jgi:hypothetical protein
MPTPSGSGITVSTPRPIDPMYTQLLDMFEKKIYEMEGISQLSAQSKKPGGLNSGVALDTLQDVESERHNVLLQAMIKMYMDVAKICIQVFPDSANVLPEKTGRADIKWKDIKIAKDLFTVQFSSSSSLSKDPKTKMEQIEKLQSLNLINPGMIASLLDLPDLNEAYSVMTASYDYSQKIIERALEDGEFNFYEVGDIKQLYSEVVTTILRLDANDEKPEIIANAVLLLAKVKDKMDEIESAMAPPMPPPAPIAPPMPQIEQSIPMV